MGLKSAVSGPSGCALIWTAVPFKASPRGESYREPARHKERNTHIMGLLIWVPQHFPSRFMSWGLFTVERQSMELTAQHCSAHLLIYFLSSSLGFISSQVHASPSTEVAFFLSHLGLCIIKLALLLPWIFWGQGGNHYSARDPNKWAKLAWSVGTGWKLSKKTHTDQFQSPPVFKVTQYLQF